MKSSMYFIPICLFLSSCRTGDNNQGSPPGKLSELVTPTDSNSMYFPLKKSPRDTASHDQALDTLVDKRYSHVLFALNEPILSNYTGPKEVYRFTYIRPFVHPPVSLTIIRDGNTYQLTFRTRMYAERIRPDGSIVTASHVDTALVDTTFDVKSEEWQNFRHYLDKANIWSLPVTTDDVVLDGTHCILEGTRNGEYHFAIRVSLSESRFPDYYECYRFLHDLARKSVNPSVIF
jgi:hypothetical protein